MDYLGYYTFFNLYILLCLYMGAFFDDIRLIDDFCFEYIPAKKFRFICLHSNKSGKKGMIKKTTRDREILALFLFFLTQTVTVICSFFVNNGVGGVVAICIQYILFTADISIYFLVRGKINDTCKAIASAKRNTPEVTEKNLARHARNVMRKKYEGKNKAYSVIKDENHTFLYDYTEYYLYIDGIKEKLLAKQQKYRYSRIVETTWLTERI